MEYLYSIRNGFYGIDAIDEQVKFCKIMEIHSSLLFTRSRRAEIVRYRRLYVNYSTMNLVELGNLFDMHHTSIMHLRRSHGEYLKFDRLYARKWNLLKEPI